MLFHFKTNIGWKPILETNIGKTFSKFKIAKKSLVLNGRLLEKCFVMQKAITVYCV